MAGAYSGGVCVAVARLGVSRRAGSQTFTVRRPVAIHRKTNARKPCLRTFSPLQPPKHSKKVCACAVCGLSETAGIVTQPFLAV